MKRETGISTVGAVLITAVDVGGGVGAFAFYQHQQLLQVRGELAQTQAQLQTTTASLNAARTQMAALQKEFDEQKIAFDQARTERDSAKALLEAEKQHSERIRAELTVAREMLASLRARPAFAAPQLVRPPPMRVVPAPGGSAIGAPMQAQPAPAPR